MRIFWKKTVNRFSVRDSAPRIPFASGGSLLPHRYSRPLLQIYRVRF